MVSKLRAWIEIGLTLVATTLLAPRQSVAEIEIYPQIPPSAEIAGLSEQLLSELSKSGAGLSIEIRVAVGIAAFRQALAAEDDRPLIAAYVTSTDFDAALGMRTRPSHVTAVFSNPDPVAQVALAQALLGRSAIGVFDTPASRTLVSRLAHLPVQRIEVFPGQGIDSLLRKATPVDAIIVLPDPAVLNRSNIGHVVRSLYHRRQVLIGYSATMTRVGGLASVYATSETIAREVARTIAVYESSGALPPPTFPRDLGVAVNTPLARSLNMALPTEAELLDAVRSAVDKDVP